MKNARHRDIACFALAALGTFALWFFSPQLFHYSVPWANKAWPYLAALFVIGAACRLIFESTPKLIYGGVVAGAALGTVWPEFHIAELCVPCQFVPLGLLSMAGPLGAWIVSLLRR